jgi:putative endoribonuclease L-PSP
VDVEKRISGKPPASWVILAIAVIAVVCALAGIFWPWLRDILGDKDRGAIVGALLAGSGLMISVWAAQERSSYELRFTAKEERDRRSLEDEKDRKLRLEQELKDRRQHSATQRIELSRKLTTAIPHIGDSNSLIQAAGIVELLFQIDDWYALTTSEMENEESGLKIEELKEEGKRRRQEIFNLIYNSRTNFPEVLNARVVGLIERLKDDASIRSLDDLDMSNLQLGRIPVSDGNDQEPEYFSANFSGLSFMSDSKIYISGDLSGADFSRSKLSNISFVNSDLGGADFSRVELCKIDFSKSKLAESTFEKAKLHKCCFNEAFLSCVNFKYINLDNTTSLQGANLECANLSDAVMNGVNLQSVNLSNANLGDAQLNNANLSHARLTGATGLDTRMAEADLYFANLDNVDFNNIDLSDSILRFASLREATFKKSHFNRAFMWKANLEGAKFFRSEAVGANFVEVDAVGVGFGMSDVCGSDFSFSKLRNSTFGDTSIGETVFRNADLRDVNFECAKISATTFDGAYLCGGNFGTVDWTFNWDNAEPYSSWVDAKYSDDTIFPRQFDPSTAIFEIDGRGMIKWSAEEWEKWDNRPGVQTLGNRVEIFDSIIRFCEGKGNLEAIKQECIALREIQLKTDRDVALQLTRIQARHLPQYQPHD